MLDPKFIGWTSAPFTVEVEKGRLRFFASVIGETNPLYTDEAVARAAGYRSLLLPPTFLFCLEMEKPSSQEIFRDLQVDYSKVLHGEQAFSYYKPVCAGDQITFQTSITDIYAKKGGALEFIVKNTTATNQENELVAEMRTVAVIRNQVGEE